MCSLDTVVQAYFPPDKTYLTSTDADQPEAVAIVWVRGWVIDRGEQAFGFRQHRATAI